MLRKMQCELWMSVAILIDTNYTKQYDSKFRTQLLRLLMCKFNNIFE